MTVIRGTRSAIYLLAQGTANVVIGRRKFDLRVQQEGESLDNFLDNCQESVLWDTVVIRIRDGSAILSLWAQKDLKLLEEP